MDYQYKVKRYPSLPAHTIPRTSFRDTTANTLTKSIIRFFEIQGHKAWRQSSEGRYRPGIAYTDVLGHQKQLPGRWLPGTNVGNGDINVIIAGRFYAIEVKMNDKQSQKQKQFQKAIEDSGGIYYLCRSFEEFLTWYNSITK